MYSFVLFIGHTNEVVEIFIIEKKRKSIIGINLINIKLFAEQQKQRQIMGKKDLKFLEINMYILVKGFHEILGILSFHFKDLFGNNLL